MENYSPPPTLLIMFNRPHKAAQVLERVRQVRPPKMFIVIDGARSNRPGEAEKIHRCRALKDTIDWECDLKINFAETNMGCKNRIASGITWAFEYVDELIILEDDCVPDLTFFRYCRELLDKYRNDNRIFSIGGSNRDYCEPFDESYAFSKRFYGWGWATWKRAWKNFDISMSQWSELKQDRYLKNIFRKHDRRNIENEFQMTYEGKIDTWDYIWWLNSLENHALHIVPRTNLVRNTGFGVDGTHTAFPVFEHLYMDNAINFPLIHPKIISPLDRLFVNPTFPENPAERAEFQKNSEQALAEYDSTFRQLLNLKQFHAVIILFEELLRKRITPHLTQRHLNFVWYTVLAHFNLGDFEHAEALADVLLTFEPHNIELLIFSTGASMRQKNFQKAHDKVALLKKLNVTNDIQKEQIANLVGALKTLTD